LRRVRNLLITLPAITGFLVLTIMFTAFVPWWALKLAGPWKDPTGDVLIVLSGSSMGDGIIGQSSYWRCVYAVRAYRQTPFDKIIVSGGGPVHTATLMHDFLVSEGIPADRIVVEDHSTSTRENALYTKELLTGADQNLVLLTSDYHMFRAWRAFRKVDLNVAPRPFPDIIKQSCFRPMRWPAFFELCGESAKSAYYWVRGWI
jgi:uncharacterized SAM-binding protein YcdF (DUF218 family)